MKLSSFSFDCCRTQEGLLANSLATSHSIVSTFGELKNVWMIKVLVDK